MYIGLYVLPRINSELLHVCNVFNNNNGQEAVTVRDSSEMRAANYWQDVYRVGLILFLGRDCRKATINV